ncbi:MAG: CocE/NonD family hydrolase [Gemmatimonadetes bacterium]|nr:CocE/NonD family hydrolase [Gemmatimonadota bacterium]
MLVAALLLTQASQPPVRLEYDVRVPMRDGATLSADITRPVGSARSPVILVRTPYDNGAAHHVAEGKRWAERGYAYVVQDVRGRGESDGTFYPLVTEGDDGYDTIEWLARQPWSNGRVGMMGGSYLGWVQMYAAVRKPPSLKALIPIVTPPDPDRNFPVQFGAYGPATLSWLAAVSGKTMQDISQHDLRAVYSHLPLYQADRLLGRTLTAWRDWLDHPTRDAYWEAQSFQAALEGVDLPMLHISGWYDDVLVGTTENYAITRARPNQRLLIGPWGHQVNRRKLGSLDFGPTAVVNLDSLYHRWFDRWLKEVPNGAERDSPVRVFVMGENRWRDEAAWPLERTRYVRFYLRSRGKANSRFGDGRLDTLPPGESPPDRYRSDPADPFPFVTDDAFSQIGGPDDYREVERRHDVLVYSSAPLAAPMEVCGPLAVSLHAASTAKDVDFATKVLAVRPDGFALRLNDGVVRARFRHGRDKEILLEPGRVEHYQIDNWSTCITMGRGWRLRLEVASHAFPKFDRNLQTGGPIGKEAHGMVAEQTVYHDAQRPSYLLVPVVPRTPTPRR